MALRLWLPLNGSLVNQGLDDVAVTNNGATVNDAGKIGKCYEFGTTTNSLSVTPDFIKDISGGCSFVFWVKFTDYGVNYQTVFDINDGNISWNNEIFAFQKNGSAKRLVFTMAGTNGYTSASCVTQSDFELNKWYHFVCVYNPGQMIIYKDGEHEYTYNTTVVPKVSAVKNFVIGAATTAGTYQSKSLLNDFRVYDHVLSLREIKELSKGLVLHYPLSDPYVEGTTNLITSEDCLSSTCYNGATSKYSYGTASDMYKTVTTFEGRKGTKVYMGTDGKAAYPYVYINNMYTSNGTNSPEYKTLSFDYYTTISTSISPYKLGNGTGTATYKVTNTTTKTGTGTNSVVIPVEPNMWNHIEITFHGTTDADAQWGYIQNQPSHISDTSNFWFFANMQLEAKDHATGYTPFGTTRDENIVYDVSGYGNNGTITGSLAYSSDTPRYLGSTVFDSGMDIVSINPLTACSQFTIAGWINLTTGYVVNNGFHLIGFDGTYCRICISKDGVAVRILLTDGTTNYFGGSVMRASALVPEEWNHYAITFNKGNINIYINGVLDVTTTATITSVAFPSNHIRIGRCSNEQPKGKASDIRFYTTALSADDILVLYNTPISIANNGTLLTQGEISEV